MEVRALSGRFRKFGDIRAAPGGATRAPPHVYFAGSAVFHYLGPSFAVLLFARVAPLGVAWLRIVSAALVFACWRKPWRALAAAEWPVVRLVAGLGIVLAVMNCCFYMAIDRLPLATVSAIEFLPVVALAAFGVRSLRNAVALAFAIGGVYLLTKVELSGRPLGLLFALGNAVMFALYIMLAHRLAGTASLPRIDGLAAAMLVAATAITPIGAAGIAGHLLDPVALGAGAGVGIASSVIPYVCDQLAMARLPRASYALFTALLPAVATATGVIVLAQLPSLMQCAGIALVSAGVACHRPGAEDQLPPATSGPSGRSLSASRGQIFASQRPRTSS